MILYFRQILIKCPITVVKYLFCRRAIKTARVHNKRLRFFLAAYKCGGEHCCAFDRHRVQTEICVKANYNTFYSPRTE